MVWQRFLRPTTRYKSVIQSHALTGYFGLSSEKEGKKSNAVGTKRYDQRLKTNAPLVPPKPKEFDRA